MDYKDYEKNKRTNFSRFCRPSSVSLMSSWYPRRQGSNARKQTPNFKTDEVKFFLYVKKRKMTLFGTLSPTLTFILKMQTWLEVRNQLVAAVFPQRTKEQLKKKWESLLSATKAKYAKRKKTGGGAIEWTDVDELITEILGKENPSLV